LAPRAFRALAFDIAFARHNIRSSLTKPKHPWSNGQVERMNRTIEDASVKRFYYESHDEIQVQLTDFETTYNFAKRLKIPQGAHILRVHLQVWTKAPERFTFNPLQQMPGLII